MHAKAVDCAWEKPVGFDQLCKPPPRIKKIIIRSDEWTVEYRLRQNIRVVLRVRPVIFG